MRPVLPNTGLAFCLRSFCVLVEYRFNAGVNPEVDTFVSSPYLRRFIRTAHAPLPSAFFVLPRCALGLPPTVGVLCGCQSRLSSPCSVPQSLSPTVSVRPPLVYVLASTALVPHLDQPSIHSPFFREKQRLGQSRFALAGFFGKPAKLELRVQDV